MKQAKKSNNKNKISYLKPGFLIPMIYSIFTAILMGLAISISKAPRVSNVALAEMVMKAAMVSIAISPSALIVCGALAIRHRNKYMLEPFLYSDAPVMFSFIVMGCQIFYLYALTL